MDIIPLVSGHSSLSEIIVGSYTFLSMYYVNHMELLLISSTPFLVYSIRIRILYIKMSTLKKNVFYSITFHTFFAILVKPNV